ncbi:fibronectin type III domain-containing protein [Spirosoma spitsbergense]|uniref:fibronectin type III domain-containing protein n=1 Tax=Spirosoma spitsbergense TaxID=431554 RepID=UPI0003624461|nr:fibronectin type III domain-containing protein [Spirosoma spitsbergense]
MRYLILLILLAISGLLGLSSSHSAQAQSLPGSTSFICGAPELTREQAISLVQAAELAFKRKKASITSGESLPPITYVPIRPHIIRRSDGTGGYSLVSMNQVMALTNSYYLLNGMGIQFYFAGATPDYIDNDDMFNSYSNQSVDTYDARNAMNQYYVNQFSNPGLGGYAYYPYDAIYSTRSFILNENNIEDMGNRLVPHELGHSFNLIHTFGNNNGTQTTTELVTRGNGANCTTDGDLICDTPADPATMAGTSFIYPNGCIEYDPNSTARDANGDAYAPFVTNIMSYYFPCTHDFTPGQHDRMQAALALRQSHTAYTLDAPPTNVSAPTNFTAGPIGYSVRLTWQDNATNETGYFVERSTSPTTGFVPIGGVAPDGVSFTDTKVTVNTQYYYRIRPSNTTTGSLSPVADVFFSQPVLVVTGLTTTSVTSSSAKLSWNSLGDYITYDLQWRILGSPYWNSAFNIAQPTTDLTYLNGNTTYEWQVKVTGSDTYSGPVTFTTICPQASPTYTSSNPARTTASLSWGGANYFPGYTLQWRTAGSADWTSISINNNSYYTLTGLTSATTYEWRVQGVCSASAASAFTSPQSFTTYACLVPTSLYTGTVRSGSALVNWYIPYGYSDPTVRFDLRYRPVGTPTWTTVSSLTGNSYNLTGLTNNTTYEWQVKSVCSATEQSDFSSSITFTTFCLAPYSLSSRSTATSALLSFGYAGFPEFGSTYEIQYRVVGTTDWTVVTGNLTSGAYGSRQITGLATNTTYECRVRTACSANAFSDFTTTNTFTTGCYAPEPYSLYVGSILSSSVDLNWSLSFDAGTTFDLRYRPVGAPEWTNLTSLTATTSYGGSAHLAGLPNNTPFEWQLRLVCSPTESSTYTSGPNFSTRCQSPSPQTVDTRVASAVVYWTPTESGATYDVRYRQSGATDWITITNLSSTSAVLSGLTGNTSYEWQVQSHCSDNSYSGFSGSYFQTRSCNMPYYLFATVNTNYARVNWSIDVADVNTRFEIMYKSSDVSNWTHATNLSTDTGKGDYDLPGLEANKRYQWQLRTLCSPTENSAYVFGPDFVTGCPTPTNLYTIAHPTTANLSWTQPGINVNYEVRYRLVGATDWITISNPTSTTVLATGLTDNTAYEWQVKTHCGSSDSDFSNVANFTTTPCPPPYYAFTTNLTTTAARLNWNIGYADVDTRFEARYRLVGATDWITLSNLSSDNGFGYFNLMGLAVDSPYEWQIKTLCSATSGSVFTNSVSFRTVNPCSSMYTLKAGLWNDPTVWSCNRVPLASDPVQIKHAVTIPASYQAHVMRVMYDMGQQVVFSQGSTLQFGQ